MIRRRRSALPLRSVLLASLPALLSGALLAQDQDDVARRVEGMQRALAEMTAEMAALRAGLEGSSATDPALRLEWYARHAALAAEPAHADLAWQHLGPTNISGRVTDVAVPSPRGETYTLYCATASGGVWKTDNDGVSWRRIFDEAPTASIGALGLDPRDHDVLWVGTGEANIFRSSMAGCGVYLTRDGGETWEHKGLAGTHTIARVVVHPEDSDTVYVAASGHEWTDNEERGVYRTRDGGATWERILYVDAGTGAIDFVLDESKPDVLYAATWERRRLRWNDPRNHAGTRGSGVWRSDDGGDTWAPINAGLPAPEHRGRIGIDLARSNPSVVYAFVDNYEKQDEAPEGLDSYGRPREAAIKGAELYRSDDRGRSWRRVSESNQYMFRLSATYGWVFGQMRVDPTDEDTVYLMGLALNVSNDAGKTFRRLRGMHGDHHALWIDPRNPDYLVNGNDGGIVVSYDGGARWRQHLDNLPAVQFYNVGYDMAEPFKVYGSIQDHGSMVGVVDLSRGRDRIRATAWERAPGGEASYHAVDPTDTNTLYAEGFYGQIFRQDLASGERARIAPKAADGEPTLRGQWLAPFLISPHNPRIVYHGMNRLYRSMDRGENFQPISPDLSRNQPDELGDIPFQTISSIDESPFHFGLVYAGTDDGRLHVTPDAGVTWNDITRGLVSERWISRVIASRHDADTVYVAQNGKRWDDLSAYLWRSHDRGATWARLSAGIPGAPINVVREDPKNADVLYVGTDLGVYVSENRGATWDVLGAGLPTTYVHDLIVHPRDDVIVIATHGHGMWALDARPIQGEVAEEPGEGSDEPWGDEEEEDD